MEQAFGYYIGVKPILLLRLHLHLLLLSFSKTGTNSVKILLKAIHQRRTLSTCSNIVLGVLDYLIIDTELMLTVVGQTREAVCRMT